MHAIHMRVSLHEQTLEGIEERLRVVLHHTPTDTDLLTFQFDRGRNESGLVLCLCSARVLCGGDGGVRGRTGSGGATCARENTARVHTSVSVVNK